MSNESDVSLSWDVTAGKPDSPSMRIVNAEKALALTAAVERLPEAQRTAITMRHIGGATLAEICAAMGRSPASVAGLLRRGLQALRRNSGTNPVGPGLVVIRFDQARPAELAPVFRLMAFLHKVETPKPNHIMLRFGDNRSQRYLRLS